jgi:hypothetical protein
MLIPLFFYNVASFGVSLCTCWTLSLVWLTPKPLWVALDHFDRVAFIGISPAVRISPIGVMRSNPRHRSTVFVISSYPQLAPRSLRLARLGRELTRTARCLTARRFEVGDLAR